MRYGVSTALRNILESTRRRAVRNEETDRAFRSRQPHGQVQDGRIYRETIWLHCPVHHPDRSVPLHDGLDFNKIIGNHRGGWCVPLSPIKEKYGKAKTRA